MAVTKPWREPNPLGQTPTRFRERPRVFVEIPGQSPGTMEHDDKGAAVDVQPGTIRRLWRQTIAGDPGPPPFQVSAAPAIFTRALRYKASTTYYPAGNSASRLSGMHTVIRMIARQPRPVLEAGTRRARPTIRNRMTSFGSRVEPLNRRAQGAQPEHT